MTTTTTTTTTTTMEGRGRLTTMVPNSGLGVVADDMAMDAPAWRTGGGATVDKNERNLLGGGGGGGGGGEEETTKVADLATTMTTGIPVSSSLSRVWRSSATTLATTVGSSSSSTAVMGDDLYSPGGGGTSTDTTTAAAAAATTHDPMSRRAVPIRHTIGPASNLPVPAGRGTTRPCAGIRRPRVKERGSVHAVSHNLTSQLTSASTDFSPGLAHGPDVFNTHRGSVYDCHAGCPRMVLPTKSGNNGILGQGDTSPQLVVAILRRDANTHGVGEGGGDYCQCSSLSLCHHRRTFPPLLCTTTTNYYCLLVG